MRFFYRVRNVVDHARHQDDVGNCSECMQEGVLHALYNTAPYVFVAVRCECYLAREQLIQHRTRRWPDIAGRPYTIAQLEPDDGFEGLVEVQARDLAIVEIESSERLLKRTYL